MLLSLPTAFFVRYFFVPQPQPPRFSSCGLEVEQLPPAFFSSLLVSHPEVLVPHFSSFISLFLLIGKTCHPHKEQLPRQTTECKINRPLPLFADPPCSARTPSTISTTPPILPCRRGGTYLQTSPLLRGPSPNLGEGYKGCRGCREYSLVIPAIPAILAILAILATLGTAKQKR